LCVCAYTETLSGLTSEKANSTTFGNVCSEKDPYSIS
jgi:hypothetical protein